MKKDQPLRGYNFTVDIPKQETLEERREKINKIIQQQLEGVTFIEYENVIRGKRITGPERRPNSQ